MVCTIGRWVTKEFYSAVCTITSEDLLPLSDDVYFSGKFGDLIIPFSASVILPPQSPKGLWAWINIYLNIEYE